MFEFEDYTGNHKKIFFSLFIPESLCRCCCCFSWEFLCSQPGLITLNIFIWMEYSITHTYHFLFPFNEMREKSIFSPLVFPFEHYTYKPFKQHPTIEMDLNEMQNGCSHILIQQYIQYTMNLLIEYTMSNMHHFDIQQHNIFDVRFYCAFSQYYIPVAHSYSLYGRGKKT